MGIHVSVYTTRIECPEGNESGDICRTQLEMYACMKNYEHDSFSCDTPRLWKELTPELAGDSSLPLFRKGFKTYLSTRAFSL